MSEELTHQLINVSATKEKGSTVVLINERVNGEKQVHKIKKPICGFYFLNEAARATAGDKKPSYMELQHLDYYEVEFDDLVSAIVDLINETDFNIERKTKYIEHYNYCLTNKKMRDLSAIFRHPFVYGADTNIADAYYAKWFEEHEGHIDVAAKLVKTYFDIEVDIIDIDGFPEESEAPCPVSVISFVIEEQAYLFLKMLPSESMKHFLANDKERFVADMLDLYGDKLKDELNLSYKPITDLKIHVFEEELDLIQNFFELLFQLKPDTCSAWNLKFDFVTLMNRILKLGYDPTALMVPRELKDIAQVYYYEDTYNRDNADKKDTATCTGYTTYLDQLLIFASLRKTMGKRDSYTLDAILEEETGFSKLDLDGETLKRLPYSDYYTYLHYSLRDTIGLKVLENKVKDIDLIYTLSQKTKTRLEKSFTKTISLRNFAYEFNKDKAILKCNPNTGQFLGEVKPAAPKFEGAVVADPTLVAPVYVEALGFDSSYIRDNSVDQDYEALYPSIMRAFEVDGNTFLGTFDLDLDPDLYDPEDPSKRTKQFVEYAISDNVLQTGIEFLGLPSISDVIEGLIHD